jgi:hypothetical protein
LRMPSRFLNSMTGTSALFQYCMEAPVLAHQCAGALMRPTALPGPCLPNGRRLGNLQLREAAHQTGMHVVTGQAAEARHVQQQGGHHVAGPLPVAGAAGPAGNSGEGGWGAGCVHAPAPRPLVPPASRSTCLLPAVAAQTVGAAGSRACRVLSFRGAAWRLLAQSEDEAPHTGAASLYYTLTHVIPSCYGAGVTSAGTSAHRQSPGR